MIKIGEINTLQVRRKTDIGYMLIDDEASDIILPFNQVDEELTNGQNVDAFILLDSKKRLVASLNKPNILVGKPGFVTVNNVKKELGVFIDNNVIKDPLISNDDLPFDYNLWPEVGDTLFCKLKSTSSNLIAKIVTPEECKNILEPTTKLSKFMKVEALVIKNGSKGTNLITKEGHSIFVYYKHRRRDYRVGETVTVTINNVCLDGTYNGTLLETKVKLMKEDADVILEYIKDNGGVMNFTTKSSVKDIEEKFKMSKASFKRALSNLYKQRLIEFKDDKTYLVK